MGFNFLNWVRGRSTHRPVTEVRTPRVQFVGEQDGPVERRAKAEWVPILRANLIIDRAFLVRTIYMDNTQHVVLALCSGGAPDVDLVHKLRAPYAQIFSSDCPLDMASVSAAQKSEIEKVCPPFYIAS
jgi:hypothetical protein